MMTQNETAGAPVTSKEQLEIIEAYFPKNSSASKPTGEKKQDNQIVFAIPLMSKAVSRDWARVQSSLSKTLRSILRSTDQNFRIIIAGHEKPQIKELQHKKVKWLSVDYPLTSDFIGCADKHQKRRTIGAYLRKKGFSGYFMPLDADDWIHYRFVEFIRSRPKLDAFVMTNGFMVNLKQKELWMRDHFYIGCGSSAVYYFSNHEFPLTPSKNDSQTTYFGGIVKSHKKVFKHLKKYNKKFFKVEFPFVTYVLAHGDNWSIIKRIRSNKISSKYYRVTGEKLREWYYDYFRIKEQ